jgi:tetratricopeptide (TPR) repeat protein
MTPEPHNSVEVFYSYAHEHETLCDELKKHLANLKRQGVITDWYDRDISAGKEWDEEIERHLNSAKVILLLVSPDFMDSDYINDVEGKRAMERHEAREARVIPVILRPVDWEGTPFSKLQALPTDAKPVTSWGDRDEAFLSVSKAIRKALTELRERKALKKLTEENHAFTPANIPRPPVVGFVARRDSEGRDIVKRLKEELAPERGQLVVLHGPGGVGKTTLAAETARNLSDLFDGHIVWISADGREAFNLLTLFDEIATQMGRDDLRQLKSEQKAAAVATVLTAEKRLVVLDNFETIAGDEQTRCVEFLSKHVTCPALITTRLRIASVLNITIPAMESAEAEEFLKRLIAGTSDPHAFAQVDLERVKQISARNPLVMQWVIAQIDLAQEADAVLDELTHGGGEAAEHVFDRSFKLEHLGDDGRAALLSLSLFVPDASRAALAEVSGFGADLKRLNEAVKRLASLALVKTTAKGTRLIIEGLTRELAKARLSRSEFVGEFRRRFLAHFVRYAAAHSQPTPEDFDALETEKENEFSSMDLAFELNDWPNVVRLMNALSFDGVNGFLAIRGYWEEAVRFGIQALEAAQNGLNDATVAHFSHNLAISYQRRGDLAEARQLYLDSLEIERKLENENGVAITLHELGRLAQAQSELEEAQRLYLESLEIAKKLGNQSVIASTMHNLAGLAQARGELEEARRLYLESLQIEKKLGHQSGIAISLHQLATLSHKKGELEEAQRLYSESLKINKGLGDQNGIAHTLGQLGILEEDQGNLDEAARLLREALEILEKLGSPNAEIARRILARVEAKSS